MRISTLAVCTVLLGLTAPLSAQKAEEPPEKGSGPCAQIAAACKSAGFIEGDYKTGNGLHVDCIDPIMRGTPPPHKTKLSLPQVNPELIASCKAKHPDFGEPKPHK
jgi:hypothetical protein